MKDAFPPPALTADVLKEYVYGNFPWPDIRDWLLPQIPQYRRILLLDGTISAAVAERPARFLEP